MHGSLNKFLISHDNKLSVITWNGRSTEVSNIKEVISLEPNADDLYIWCDGKADPRGNLWSGSNVEILFS